MSQSDEVAKQRAIEALGRITGSGSSQLVMHIGSYRTDEKGGSVRCTMGDRFATAHDLDKGEDLDQFYDAQSGALVILPQGGVREPGFEVDD